ncbi:hypothetical protein V1478_014545 [Vespula squamosa]|uniref:Uncharacterized protein n=1 Tax=Vespula squamosa TaxID=30214 RepID=A0ABD2A8C5_VESSQ
MEELIRREKDPNKSTSSRHFVRSQTLTKSSEYIRKFLEIAKNDETRREKFELENEEKEEEEEEEEEEDDR